MNNTVNKIKIVGGKRQVNDLYETFPDVEVEYVHFGTDTAIIDKVKEIIGAIKNDS